MTFVGEFATFLHAKDILKFGDFTLASGKTSQYYVDLRMISGYPVIFRRVVKEIERMILRDVGLDNFDTFVSVPTGGLVIAAALATETVKPLAYVREKAKEHGTSRRIEGRIVKGMKAIMIDDVATTGGSMMHGIRRLRDAEVSITDAYVIVDRLAGASEALSAEVLQISGR